MTQQYRLTPAFFTAMNRRVLLQAIALSLVAMCGAVAISSQSVGAASPRTLALVIPLLLVSMGYGLYSSLRRERSAWRTFEIVVSEQSITRRMSGRPDITLTPMSLTAVSETRDGTLTLRGSSVNETIFVPGLLDGIADVRAVAATWQPIVNQATRPSGLNVLAGVAAVALMVIAFTSQTPGIAAPASLILGVGLVWAAWSIHCNHHLDKRVRRNAWFALLPAFAALVRAYTLLFP